MNMLEHDLQFYRFIDAELDFMQIVIFNYERFWNDKIECLY